MESAQLQSPTPVQAAHWKDKWQSLRQKYEAYLPAAFFVGGFLFDLITLSRIDDEWAILQQGLFLLAIAFFLWIELSYCENGKAREGWHPWLKKVWQFYPEAIHFLFGSLLSAYAIYYFLSASIWTSGAFLLLITSLLVINEFPSFQKRGISIRFTLFSLCLFSYSAYVLPILFGSIGTLVFLLSIATTAALSYGLLHISPVESRPFFLRHAGIPAAVLLSLITSLYFVKMIPPVPISLKHLGVYHSVAVAEGKYELSYLPSFWSFITGGNTTFKALPGDRVYVFASVFSPAKFTDSLSLIWQHKEASGDWKSWDKIPLRITGGRAEGFRGYAFKSNYVPGEWRLLVQTSDGREIGRLHFDIEESLDSELPRQFVSKTL